jgi:hypothetical protein
MEMEMIRVPLKAEEFKPPKQANLITEAQNFQRAHWDEIKPFFRALSGEEPSIHDAPDLDEAACVFKVQEIAKENGFAVLASVSAAKLRLALRYAYKRNTGITIGQLKSQGKQLRLEHQR